MSKRYEKVPIRLTAKQLAKLNKTPAGTAASIVLNDKGEPFDVYVTRAVANKIAQGGKRIKFSASAMKAMRGAGILTDTAKLASNVVQGVVDQFDPSGDNKLANTASDILLEAADVLERGFQGKKPVDYQKVADQHNRAVERAKKYVEADESERKKVHAATKKAVGRTPLKVLVPDTFEKYDERMTSMSKLPKQSAKTAKAERFKLMRGDKRSKAKADEIVGKITDTVKDNAGKLVTSKAVSKITDKAPIVGDLLSGAVESIGKKKVYTGLGRVRKAAKPKGPITGRPMRPMRGLGVSGDTVGEHAANFIREALKKS